MALRDAYLEGCSSRSPKQRQDSGYASIGPGEESQLTRSLSLVTTRSATRVPEHVGSINIPQLLSWKDVQTRGNVDLVFHADGSSQGKTLDPSQQRNLCSLNRRSRPRCYDPLNGSRISGSKAISFRRHFRSDAEDSTEA
jgi:hypothetical protein